MLTKLEDYIIDNDLFSHDDKILLGVSGGIDSMVLLSALKTLGYKTIVAHCNFNLRGDESNGDEQLVINYCTLNDIPFVVKHFFTTKYAQSKGISIQMAARELRYSWFNEMMKKNTCSKIVVAHNANDQVETFFINVLRNSGIKGLAGMKPLNKNIARPFLGIFRDEISKYQRLNNIPYREDSSNASDKYLRNKLRHHVLPALQQIDENFLANFSEAMNKLRISNQFISTETEKYNLIKQGKDGSVEITIGDWINSENALSILFEILSPYSFNYQNIKSILLNLKEDTRNKLYLSGRYKLITGIRMLTIQTLQTDQLTNQSIEILENETHIQKPILLSIQKVEYNKDEIDFKTDINTGYFDYSKIKYPLIVRKWKNGDKFIPFGMNSYKKLSDFMIDNKFTYQEKENCWLLCNNNGEIIWVIGYRTSTTTQITTKTHTILKIKFYGVD